MQTGDRHKTKYFQDNIVLWKTFQDGISEQDFFLFVQYYGIFARAYRLEKDLFTNEVSFLLNCSSHSSFFLSEMTFSILGMIAIERSVRARRGPCWLRVKTLSIQGRGSE